MSEDNDKESKTEEATSRRVEAALEKGNMPTSREVGLFASIIAVAVALPAPSPTSR
jgi:flagellar biosynthesis protein FlhB